MPVGNLRAGGQTRNPRRRNRPADVPADVLAKYPGIVAGIEELEKQGFPVLVKDASLGGQFPVMCVTLMNPRTGGVFASFGAHPSLEWRWSAA